jgi:hypothetical protein
VSVLRILGRQHSAPARPAQLEPAHVGGAKATSRAARESRVSSGAAPR